MTLEHRALVYAVELARFGSFARAAKSLGVTHPALSRAIQGLEDGLGVSLFDRHPRGVTPTPRGERFLTHATAILGELKDLELEVAGDAATRAGSVRVGMGPLIASALVSTTLAPFTAANPSIDLELVVDYGDRLARMLRAREIDLLVGSGATFATDPDLCIVPLPKQTHACYVRPGHPLTAVAKVSPKEVLRHRLALVSGSSERRWIAARVRALYGSTPRAMLANNVEALRAVVAATDAVGVEPEGLIAPEIAQRRFVLLSLTFTLPQTELVIAWHADYSLSSPAQRLALAVASQLGVHLPLPS